ncbi:MAG: hypothetical protein ACON4R_00515 [Akkermansiaceae bacterium]
MIIVKEGKSPPVGQTVETADSGDVLEGLPLQVEKDTIALVSTEGMTSKYRFAINFLAGIENSGHDSILPDVNSFFLELPREI